MHLIQIATLALLLVSYEHKEYRRTKSKLTLGAIVCTYIVVAGSLSEYVITKFF
jgi:hypothetical protein